MLTRSPDEPINKYVDENVGFDIWAQFLYGFGKDCTNSISSRRPLMGKVLQALESLRRFQSKPMSLQIYHDQRNQTASNSVDLMGHEAPPTSSTRKLSVVTFLMVGDETFL